MAGFEMELITQNLVTSPTSPTNRYVKSKPYTRNSSVWVWDSRDSRDSIDDDFQKKTSPTRPPSYA